MAANTSHPVLRPLSYLEASVNPYVYDYSKLNFSRWQKVKIALGTVTLLPVRLILLCIMAILAWLVSLMIMMGLKSRPSTDIYVRWRRVLCRVLIVLSRAALVCLGYWRIKEKGQLAPREEAPVLAVPLHSSWIDFLATAVIDGRVIPISLHRKENEKIPFFGTMTTATQQIYVSRSDENSRQSALEQVKERALDNRWPHLLIFPEGWCTNRKALLPFKRGAFAPGCSIQPVLFHYPSDVDITTWAWNGLHPGKSIYLTLCRLVNHMEIEYHPVYKPSEEERTDPMLFAKNVQKLMSKTLDLPTTEYTLADLRAMMGGSYHSVPVSKGMREFIKLEDTLCMGLSEMKARVGGFRTSTDGYVNPEDLAAYLNVPMSPELNEIFKLYEKNVDGKINLRQYLISVVLMCHPDCTDKTMRFAFEVFDENSDGFVSHSELKHILSAAFHGVDDDCAEKVFTEVDVDSRGMVSYDEFAQFCSKTEKTGYKYFFRHYQLAVEEGNNTALRKHPKSD